MMKSWIPSRTSTTGRVNENRSCVVSSSFLSHHRIWQPLLLCLRVPWRVQRIGFYGDSAVRSLGLDTWMEDRSSRPGCSRTTSTFSTWWSYSNPVVASCLASAMVTVPVDMATAAEQRLIARWRQLRAHRVEADVERLQSSCATFSMDELSDLFTAMTANVVGCRWSPAPPLCLGSRTATMSVQTFFLVAVVRDPITASSPPGDVITWETGSRSGTATTSSTSPALKGCPRSQVKWMSELTDYLSCGIRWWAIENFHL